MLKDNAYHISLAFQRKGQENALAPFSIIDTIKIDAGIDSMSYETAVKIARDDWGVKLDDEGVMTIAPVSVYVTHNGTEYKAYLIWERANQNYAVIGHALRIDMYTGQASVG